MDNRFSPIENEVIKAINRRKKIKLAEIAERVYKKVPINGSIVIGNAVSRIIQKCKLYHLDWTIEGEGMGRAGKTVWKKTRRRSAST